MKVVPHRSPSHTVFVSLCQPLRCALQAKRQATSVIARLPARSQAPSRTWDGRVAVAHAVSAGDNALAVERVNGARIRGAVAGVCGRDEVRDVGCFPPVLEISFAGFS
jgi:hypothetical protein